MRRWTSDGPGRDNRALVTLMLTDIVGSTATVARVGDAAWDEMLASHYEGLRAELDRYGGREINTTGDGMMATFPSPAATIGCAMAARASAIEVGLHLRFGIHVGEVRLVGGDIRGIAAHEVQRITERAGADEILVSETTRVLAPTMRFEDRGLHTLRGVDGEHRIYKLIDTDT